VRILVLSNLYPPDQLGGYELGCRQAADGLLRAGHNVRVLTTIPRAKDSPLTPHVDRRLRLVDIYDQFYHSKARPVSNAIRNQEALSVNAFNVHVLGQVVEEFRPDVAYVWNVIGVGGLGLLAGLQQMGVPWVMHLMDHVPQTLCSLEYGGRVLPTLAAAFARLCRGRFLCCSQTTLDEITAAGVPIADRTAIVPNWVTTAGTPDRTDYLPEGRLRVVSAGAISASKGMDILIQAAGLLRDRGHIHFLVDLYGPGSNPYFQTLIRSLDLADRVRIRGPRSQDELYELYPNYDVFAFPTWSREPFGFAPMEAMAHGCVAIVSRLCGFAEWFLDGVDCLKADRNAAAFADAFERLIRHDVPVAAMGRRGSRVVLQHYRLDTVLPRIESELRAAVRAGCGPRRPAAEAYRVALLAEKTFQCLVHEAMAG
jgi:glycosyltransferase involved in cell wall biosynthesis